MKTIVLVLLLVFGLAFYGDTTLKQETTVSCASVTGGKIIAAKGTEVGEKIGKWMGQAKDVAVKSWTPGDLAETMENVWDHVLWLWVKSWWQGGQGQKIDPQILKLRREAAEQRQAAEDQCTPCVSAPVDPPVGGVDPRVMLTAAQLTGSESEQIVRTAVAVRKSRGLPARADLIIIEAGLVESELRNLTYGDRDSVGWLQQRGQWGTFAERTDVAHAAGLFFDHLVDVSGWERMSPGRAAQAVQISAYPDRYDDREDDARKWLDKIGEAPSDDTAPTLRDEVGSGCSVDPTVAGPETDGKIVTVDFSEFHNPRSVAQAIEYMKSMQGKSIPVGRCLHYVGVAYGHPGTSTRNGSYHAIEQWELTPTQYRHPNDTSPPRGALLYWNTGPGRPGHIAISNGDGQVWSTDQPRMGTIGLVKMSAFDTWGDYLGWAPPLFWRQTKVGVTRASVAA